MLITPIARVCLNSFTAWAWNLKLKSSPERFMSEILKCIASKHIDPLDTCMDVWPERFTLQSRKKIAPGLNVLEFFYVIDRL